MDEVGGGGGGGSSGGGGGGESAIGGRSGTTSVEAGDGRLRFRVGLRPGETTIVSWKKLLKDANAHGHGNAAAVGSSSVTIAALKPDGPGQDPAVQSSFSAQVNNHDDIPGPSSSSSHPSSLDSRLPPGQVGEKGEKDAAQPHRLNTVIERIERLYVGRASSDEEDLNDVVPDDDEYDTEDSFIDDTELDEYFQVDNSAIKHDGFFVNRGKLERVEPSMLPNEQPKKRRKKDGKGLDGSDDAVPASKHVKAGRQAGKVPVVGRNASVLPTVIALPNMHVEDLKFQNQVALEIPSKKRSHDSGEQPPFGVTNGDDVTLVKVTDQQKLGTHAANNQGNKMKEGGESSDTSKQRSQEKSSYSLSKQLAGKASNSNILDQSINQHEKSGIRERAEVNVADGKNSMQNVKVPPMQKREGSSSRPKSTLLEKAIRDLEKIVAESRPPIGEAQDADNLSQGVKRRLPPEVKQKLAKVARLAQASHGKISKELVNRLMSIVGHLIQLRTLKRNLKIMVNMGLSAKQEKDCRVQLVKKEVADMVKMRIPFMKSKAAEQQAGTSDDFQEISGEEKEAFKRKYSLDDALEDKICDLYDLYVDGLEEDAGPQVRKLYAELTALWPSGFMDNHGIKRGICRAKDRKRASYSRHKDPEKIKRRKMLAQGTETARVEVHTTSQPVHIQENLVASSSDNGTVLVNKPVSNNKMAGNAERMPASFLNGSKVDRPKQEKIKGTTSNYSDPKAAEIIKTKKIKRKPEMVLGDTVQFRPEKLLSLQGDDKNKSHKVQVAGSLPKANPHPTASSNF